jgi:hypothetical protein
VTVSPQTLTVVRGAKAKFTADITGSDDARVQWEADGGTVDQGGSWTAPLVSGTFHVTARSLMDSTRSATAVVVVVEGEVSITLEPDRATVAAGGPGIRFHATVTGSSNDNAVTWRVAEPGDVATVDSSGTFTATGQGSFHVIAVSDADPTKSAVAQVTVVADLVDHGGPIAPSTRTFALWWGDESAFPHDARAGVEQLLAGLDGSRYLAVADQYMRGTTASTAFWGSMLDSTLPPADTSGFDVDDAVCRALDAYGVSPREGDFVLVYTSNLRPTFVTWCAWHGSTTCHGQTVLVAFNPNPAGTFCDNSADTCSTGYTSSTLSLVSGSAHEFMEAITDPLGNAWHAAGFYEGREMADLCGLVACVELTNGVTELGDLHSNALHGCTVQ